MKTKIKIAFLMLGIILIIACKKEEKSINRELLLKYNFSIADIDEFENNHHIINDTVIYSFINKDTVRSIRVYYTESAEGINEYVKRDTSYRCYIVENNKIKFQYIIDEYYQTVNEILFYYDWEVTTLNENELVINLWSNNTQYGGNIYLNCVKK